LFGCLVVVWWLFGGGCLVVVWLMLLLKQLTPHRLNTDTGTDAGTEKGKGNVPVGVMSAADAAAAQARAEIAEIKVKKWGGNDLGRV
jgi:hypothetical protein